MYLVLIWLFDMIAMFEFFICLGFGAWCYWIRNAVNKNKNRLYLDELLLILKVNMASFTYKYE